VTNQIIIDMETGIDLINYERKRQVNEEGWTSEHDDQYKGQELALAGASYATPATWRGDAFVSHEGNPPDTWPFSKEYWKPDTSMTIAGRIRELQKAGALIAAEIDRLNRML